MTDFQPTEQQLAIVEAFNKGEDLIIEAGAGCGKTATLQLLAEQKPQQKGLFLAFNRAVADEAQSRFRRVNTLARNTHRIAYAWATANAPAILQKLKTTKATPVNKTAKELGIKEIVVDKERFSAPLLVTYASRTLSNFLRSDLPEIILEHVVLPEKALSKKISEMGREYLAKEIFDVAVLLWANILDPYKHDVKVTHDVYLKLWAMSEPKLGFDFILLDEAQDTNPVVKSVFDKQDCQKVCVGDSAQQLFQWTGAVNVMDEFPGTRLNLTQSWRFGQKIEQAANVFLERLHANIRLQGNPAIESIIAEGMPIYSENQAILTATNAGAISETLTHMRSGKKVHLVGGGDSLIRLVEGVAALREGRKSHCAELSGFDNYSELREYIENEEDGRELGIVVNLVQNYNASSLVRSLKSCESEEANADITIATVHKVKGREWAHVTLSDDMLNARDKATLDKGKEVSKERLMQWYVAVTRAKETLDPGPLADALRPLLANPTPVEEPVTLVEEAENTLTPLTDNLEAIAGSVSNREMDYNILKMLLEDDAITKDEFFIGLEYLRCRVWGNGYGYIPTREDLLRRRDSWMWEVLFPEEKKREEESRPKIMVPPHHVYWLLQVSGGDDVDKLLDDILTEARMTYSGI